MRVQSRRTDVFPTTWELPAGIALVWLLGTALALPAGQGAAFALLGHGFVWPGADLLTSLAGLATGHPGRGLAAPLRAELPPTILILTAAAAIEIGLSAITIAAISTWWRGSGPYAQVGLATRHEVAAVLGCRHLKTRTPTIRPDLANRRHA